MGVVSGWRVVLPEIIERSAKGGFDLKGVAWLLKERFLRPLYWYGMLKGREWMAQPEMVG